MNMHGWIIYNGQLGEKFIDFANWLKSAAERKNIAATLYKNNEMITFLNGHSTDFLQNDKTRESRSLHERLPDFVLFIDKDIYLARQFELIGIPVFNSAWAIEASDDKISTYQMLTAHHLPIPKTIVKPKIFYPSEHPLVSIKSILREIPLPMIIKEAFGSFGEQVYLVHSQEEIREKMDMLAERPYVFQEFISASYGQDTRLHVVGSKVVAAMKRWNQNDFRANITTGGSMEAYTPDETETRLAVKAAKSLGADFAGVDLLYGTNREPLICEVNSNAHIRNMYGATGINVGDFIIDHVIDKLTGERV